MSVPAPTPPAKKFAPRAKPAAAPSNPAPKTNDDVAPAQQANIKATATTLAPSAAVQNVSATSSSRSSLSRPPPPHQHQQQQQQQPQQQQQQHSPPEFDKDDVEALRSENKMLQTRLAAFLEFEKVKSEPVSTKGMAEVEVAALLQLMKARVRQLELALAWECSRREEAEERCFALMRRTASNV